LVGEFEMGDVAADVIGGGSINNGLVWETKVARVGERNRMTVRRL
jgi:hypothetical protein